MTRRSLGAVLGTAVGAGCLLWLGFGPGGAFARSSAAPIPPKEREVPVPGAPEGIVVAASETAASEQESAPAQPADPAPAEASGAEQTAARAPGTGPGILQVDTDQPLSIRADELEAVEEPDGRRRLVFQRQVNVDQGGLKVQSDRLEAHYAAEATQPERLVANGNVRVRQKSRELSCTRATYFPATERLECSGNAMLRDGANRVNGETIEILFGEDRVRVKGAVVNIAPDKKKPAPAASAEARPAEATP